MKHCQIEAGHDVIGMTRREEQGRAIEKLGAKASIIDGTRNLVDAAKNANVQKIIAQSISWAYEPGTVAVSEGVALPVN